MTSFTYTTGVPNPPNDPSNDVPLMQTNTNSILSIIAVDHVGFNTPGPNPAGSGGQHLQITYNSENPPSVPADPIGITYTNAGVVSASHPQLFYQNSQGNFPLSALRAMGVFATIGGAAGAVTPSSAYNIASITASGGNPNNYTIVLKANTVSGNNIVVSTQASNDLSITYTFANPNLVITFSGLSVGAALSFLVFQI